jgi:ribonuclease R
MRALPYDWYEHDEVRHCLTGRDSGIVFSLGDPVTVELVDADVATGSLSFSIVEGGTPGKTGARRRGKTKGGSRKKTSPRKKNAPRRKGKSGRSQKTQGGRKRSR